MNITANEYLALTGAVLALEDLADNQPEVYGKDANHADRALTKVWALLTPAVQREVRERTGVE